MHCKLNDEKKTIYRAQMGCLREKKIGGTEPLTENVIPFLGNLLLKSSFSSISLYL